MTAAGGHDHPSGGTKQPLLIAGGLVFLYFIVEVVGALASGSLALLADAAHTVSDALALGLAFGAAWLAGRPGTAKRSFGYLRAEVLAALVNGAVLLGLAAVIFSEAVQRLASPPNVEGGIISGVAAGGMTVNAIAALVLMRGARRNMNVRGALFHVAGDALGSAGALVAGILVAVFGWYQADPAASVFIGVLLLLGALRLLRDATHVLMEGSPSHVDTQRLLADIEGLPHVLGVHDLHTWTITSGYDAMSAHVTMGDGVTRSEEATLLGRLRALAAAKHGIAHVTVQLERGDPECEEGHLPEVQVAGEKGATDRESH